MNGAKVKGTGDPHLINREAHRAESVRDRVPIENKNTRVNAARILSVSSGARTAVGGGGGEGGGERASKHSTSSAPSSSRVSDSGGTSSGTVNYHSSSSSSNSSDDFSCFGSSNGSKSVEHSKYSVNKYLTSNSNNSNSHNNSKVSNTSYRDSTSTVTMPNPHVSSSNLTSFPTLDPHLVQVMRPHQLEAATWLLHILMGNAKVHEKEMETVIEEEQRKEDAAGVMMVNGTGKDERQLMEERLETGEVRDALDCQPLSPSLPLSGAILADDMGTGKVIQTYNIACIAQHHTTLCRTVSCCCSVMI
jgi:SNF2 family DNA or RNA helicase